MCKSYINIGRQAVGKRYNNNWKRKRRARMGYLNCTKAAEGNPI